MRSWVSGHRAHPLCAGIRDQVVTTVELKFNCFFLMPLLDAFPGRLREELETAYAQVQC